MPDAAETLRSQIGDRLMLIALTGYGQNQDKVQSREAGFDEHLVKPVDLHTLSRAIEKSRARPARAS